MATEQQYNPEGIDATLDMAQSCLGPLASFIADPSVGFIVVNGLDEIHVGPNHSWKRLERAGARFKDLETLQTAVQFLMGEYISNTRPYYEEIYPDDTRVIVIRPPLVANAPVMLIHKPRPFFTIEDWISSGALSLEATEFLRAAIHAKVNILICGDMGTGKTSLLEALATLIPDNERVGIVGQLPLPVIKSEHVISLTPLLATRDPGPGINMQYIIRNVVHRMRLDRLIVDEISGRGTKSLLERITAGNDGTIFTIRSPSIDTALMRLEAGCLLEDARLERASIRALISATVNLVVLVARVARDNPDDVAVVHISEIDSRGVYGDGRCLAFTEFQTPQDSMWIRDIFTRDAYKMPVQSLKPTGFLPLCLERIRAANIHIPMTTFQTQDSVNSRL